MGKRGMAVARSRKGEGAAPVSAGMGSSEGVIFMLKGLIISYILTAGLLLLLALFLYRFSLQEKVVNICIILIYIVVTFFAGFATGKRAGSKRFLWGLLMGILYFGVLALVSLAVNRNLQDISTNFATVFMLCAGSGMLGGMVS